MNTNQQPAAATTTVTETELARAQAELEAGGDPFGDGDPLEFEQDDETTETQETGQDGAAPAAADPAADGAIKPGEVAATPETGTTGELTAEEIAATLAAISPQQTAELNIKVPDVADISEKIAALDASREAAEQKWMAGELSDAERINELRKLNAQERELNRQLAKAETLAEIVQQQANQKAAEQEQQVFAPIHQEARAAGLDYSTDQEAVVEFNAQVQLLADLPRNKDKPVGQIYAEANRIVLAGRGLAIHHAPKPPDGKVGARSAPPIPPTIQGLPQAASQTTGGGLVEVMRGLSGHAYTEQWERLTPAQQAALLGD